MTQALIEARRLSVDYNVGTQRIRAVNGVSLQCPAGETIGLVGESGCGKTTLGRALLGLLPEQASIEGDVFYQGSALYARPKAVRMALRGKELALIFQDPMTRLNPLLTIRQHFSELLRVHLHGITRSEELRKMRQALAEVGIPPSRLGLYPHEFSGGMRQRIMIALALVLGPRFLVADEPTTSLDVIVEAQILDLLNALSRSHGLATLLITHNLGLVAQTADRVVVMYAGDIVEEAATSALFAHAAHPYTQGLLASTIHMRTTALASIEGSPPDLADPPPACRFHQRCPRARAICAERRPPMVRVNTGPDVEQRALCWFPGPDGAVQPQAPESEWGARIGLAQEDHK